MGDVARQPTWWASRRAIRNSGAEKSRKRRQRKRFSSDAGVMKGCDAHEASDRPVSACGGGQVSGGGWKAGAWRCACVCGVTPLYQQLRAEGMTFVIRSETAPAIRIQHRQFTGREDEEAAEADAADVEDQVEAREVDQPVVAHLTHLLPLGARSRDHAHHNTGRLSEGAQPTLWPCSGP